MPKSRVRRRPHRSRGSAKKLTLAAQALARGQLDLGAREDDQQRQRDEALAAFGLVAIDADQRSDDDAFVLWPENVPAVQLWLDAATQWRVGMAGATGLDYAAVEALLRINGIRGDQRRELFADLRIMEGATLRAWGEDRGR